MKAKIFNYLDHHYKNWDTTIALRYLPAVNLIKKNFKANAKILEIGSGEYGVMPYLGDSYSLTGVDVDFGNASQKNMQMVKLSGEKLPFPNDSFDVVISLDTLEHIPPPARESTISESLRVAKSFVIFGFPSGEFAKLADWYLDKFYALTHKEKFPFLSEHKQHGLPAAFEMSQHFRKYSRKFKKPINLTVQSNTNVFLWIFLLTLGFSQFKPLTFLYKLSNLIIPLLRYFNFPPVYRKIIFVDLRHGKN